MRHNNHFFDSLKWVGCIVAFYCTSCLLLGACSPLPNPNKLVEYSLRGKNSFYTATLPGIYIGTSTKPLISNSGDAIWIYASYPTMQPLPDEVTIFPNEVSTLVSTAISDLNRASSFLKELSGIHPQYTHIGKRGIYDIYHKKAEYLAIPDWEYLIFTAEDGELVFVEVPGGQLKTRIYRNIGSDVSILYLIDNKIGADYLKIDEIVTGFVKSHLQAHAYPKPVAQH